MTIDWKPYLVGGATRPDSITGLDPAFQNSLAQLFLNAPPEIQAQLRLTSGFRSPERQEQLWQEALVKYGSPEAARKWVAPPGRSKHNHGQAVDLKYLGDDAKAWAHANAERYGLHFPMAHEPWHIEPAGSRGGSVPKAPSVIDMATSGGGQAVMTGGAGDDTMQTERRGFLGRMFGDMDPERRDKLIVALEGMTHNPNQALMDQAQGRIDERRIDARTAAQVNKTVEYLRANGSGDLADAVASGVFDPGQAVTQHYSRAEAGQAQATEAARREQAAAYADQYGRADVAAAIRSGVIGPEEGGKMILTGEKIDERYKVVGSQLVDLSAEGGPKVVLAGPGEGDKPLTEIAKLKADLDAGRITPEEYDLALQRMAPKGTSIEVGADGSVRFIEGVGAGAAPGERISYSPTEVQAALDMIDAIAADPNLPRVTGTVEGGGGNDVDALNIMQRVYYGSGGVSLIEKIGQLQNTTWLAAREMLKGGGAITDYESKKAEAAMSRMSRTKDEKEFQAALTDLRDAIVEGQRKIEAARGGAATQPSGGTTVRRFNPETGKLE